MAEFGEEVNLRNLIAEAILRADDAGENAWGMADAIIADLGLVVVMAGQMGIYEDEHGRRYISDHDGWGRRLRVFAATHIGR